MINQGFAVDAEDPHPSTTVTLRGSPTCCPPTEPRFPLDIFSFAVRFFPRVAAKALSAATKAAKRSS
jgi:hypothetical protein